MPQCPNCSYELILLEHRRKFKCAKCGKLFPQKEIEVKDFQEWNKRQRKADKEVIYGKPQRQQKLREFEKKERAKESQRRFRENNREEYNSKKREYWASNHEHLLIKRRENYKRQKTNILLKQALWRQNHKAERRINSLRWEQKELALQYIEKCLYTVYNLKFSELLPTISLS